MDPAALLIEARSFLVDAQTRVAWAEKFYDVANPQLATITYEIWNRIEELKRSVTHLESLHKANSLPPAIIPQHIPIGSKRHL